jgi:hypothetical protein
MVVVGLVEDCLGEVVGFDFLVVVLVNSTEDFLPFSCLHESLLIHGHVLHFLGWRACLPP